MGKRTFLPYLNYAASAFIVLLLTTLITLWGYLKTQDNLIVDKIDETALSLHQTETRINNELLRMRAQVSNLAAETEIIEVAKANARLPNHIITLLSGRTRLLHYGFVRDSVSECAIVIPASDMLTLTPTHIVTDLELYYESGLMTCPGLTYADFGTMISRMDVTGGIYYNYLPSRQMELFNTGVGEMIIFRANMPIAGVREQPVFLAFLDAELIRENLAGLLPNEGGWYCVTDSSGNVLLENGVLPEELTIRDVPAEGRRTGKDGVILGALSEYSAGINFYVYLPDSWVKEGIAPINRSLVIHLVMAVLLGIVTSLMAAVYHSYPIRRIASQMPLDDGYTGRSQLQAIEQGVNRLYHSNLEMRETLTDWRPILRSGLLERLYKGGVVLPDELASAPEIRDNIPERFCVVMLSGKNIDAGNPDDNGEIIDELAQLLSRHFNPLLIHPFSALQVALVCDADEYDERGLFDTISGIIAQLSAKGYVFSAGIGGVFTGTASIFDSTMQARSALARITDWTKDRIGWYRQTEDEHKPYDLPYELMSRLIACVTSGSAAMATRFLDKC
ncbi:hypothetical protein LJC63_03000 [Ruminococcaceae bacterium OttesenSCG-928-L11]|nr:hypothetical protein [Ruminococcaceae bacterium OttesenSCG-928-L11]